jgi:hypothetical protein
MWEFVVESDYYWVEVDLEHASEFVFEIQYSGEQSPVDEPVAIRWYTSVDKDRGVSRPRGKDAMRVVAIHRPSNKAFFKAKRTHRIPTWRTNLEKKISRLWNRLWDVERCPECGHALIVIKTGSGRRFKGCSNYYPEQDCTYSESL